MSTTTACADREAVPLVRADRLRVALVTFRITDAAPAPAPSRRRARSARRPCRSAARSAARRACRASLVDAVGGYQAAKPAGSPSTSASSSPRSPRPRTARVRRPLAAREHVVDLLGRDDPGIVGAPDDLRQRAHAGQLVGPGVDDARFGMVMGRGVAAQTPKSSTGRRLSSRADDTDVAALRLDADRRRRRPRLVRGARSPQAAASGRRPLRGNRARDGRDAATG